MYFEFNTTNNEVRYANKEILMGYKDKTWCMSDCTNTDCFRNFTDKDREQATKWWGNDTFPIAMRDYSKECEDYK